MLLGADIIQYAKSLNIMRINSKIFFSIIRRGMLFIVLCIPSLYSQVVTYPAPSGAILSTDYTVLIENTPVDVYGQASIHGGAYSFFYFDFSGNVSIKIVSNNKKDISSASLRPDYSDVGRSMKGDTLVLVMQTAHKFSIEPDGINSPLLIFGNSLEQNPPHQGDPGVIFYPPGIYTTNINVGTNQTLYISGGAIIQGIIFLTGNNVAVTGRGIISGRTGSGYLRANNARNVSIDGVVFAGSTDWTVEPNICDSVTISNIKILNSWKQNEDGIDIVNCRDVQINDVFIRTDDDCIAIKGNDCSKTCERISIERCILWADRADVFRIGWESEVAGIMANGTHVQNCDIIHALEGGDSFHYWSLCPFGLEPSENTPMGDIRFEDIRVHVDSQAQFTLARLSPIIRTGWGWDGTVYGKYIKNVVFKNITLQGTRMPVTVYVKGIDAQHFVDSISFENINQFGSWTTPASPGVVIDSFATNIKFLCTASDTALLGIFFNMYSEILNQNSTQQIQATTEPASASRSLVWRSSNPAVASVSGSGFVTALTPGTAVIIASSPDSDKSATCNITVVPVSLPSPWLFNVIGSPDITGYASNSNNEFTLCGNGVDVWNTSDQCAFINQVHSGNGSLTVRINSQTASDDWAKAGIMFRKNLTAQSQFVQLSVTPVYGIVLQWRDSDGGQCGSLSLGIFTFPVYLKLLRIGSSFYAYSSIDGSTWSSSLGSHNSAFPESVRLGVFVSSHTLTTTSTAKFDHISISNSTSISQTNQSPTEYRLLQNFPNPFNSSTQIEFDLPQSDHVQVCVYDLQGAKVCTLVNSILQPGVYKLNFSGKAFSSGIYYYRFRSTRYTRVHKMLLLK